MGIDFGNFFRKIMNQNWPKFLKMKMKFTYLVKIFFACFLLNVSEGCKKTNTETTDNPTFVVAKVTSPVTKKFIDQATIIKNLIKDTLIQIVPGFTETEITYSDNLNKPMKVFILQIDLSFPSLTIKAATPYNSVAFGRQQVSEMARAQDGSNNRVLAAVNGDYFDSLSAVPGGIVYKDGVAIKPQNCSGCTFFAIDDQKKAFIASSADVVDFSKVKEALGGIIYFVKNHQKIVAADSSYAPRTTVGVTDNNVVYFILSDGGQPLYSNGLQYNQLSEMFYALGVKDATNLDGGGSTTLVIKKDLSWLVVNKPSDGTERPVANGWTIVNTQ